ncbi:hypothetical protein OIU76_003297 [Salix suchowensis]|nr:hypothetical protein OIU76_003297 [Salix suchowensis]
MTVQNFRKAIYDVLIENLLDPAHLPYAHYGLLTAPKLQVKSDREGGGPLDLSVKKLDSQGFFENQDLFGDTKFIAPCISYASSSPGDAPEKERKFMDVGPANWQKACFVPTKSDALVVGYRRWFNKYSGGQVDWKGKYCGALPPTSPREQLFDRYWSHVVNCRSCNAAYKGLNALEVILQVASVAFIGGCCGKQAECQYNDLTEFFCFHSLHFNSPLQSVTHYWIWFKRTWVVFVFWTEFKIRNATFQIDDSVVKTGEDLQTGTAPPTADIKPIAEEEVSDMTLKSSGCEDLEVVSCSDPRVSIMVEKFNLRLCKICLVIVWKLLLRKL